MDWFKGDKESGNRGSDHLPAHFCLNQLCQSGLSWVKESRGFLWQGQEKLQGCPGHLTDPHSLIVIPLAISIVRTVRSLNWKSLNIEPLYQQIPHQFTCGTSCFSKWGALFKSTCWLLQKRSHVVWVSGILRNIHWNQHGLKHQANQTPIECLILNMTRQPTNHQSWPPFSMIKAQSADQQIHWCGPILTSILEFAILGISWWFNPI